MVAEECIQMHGAIGMTWELPLSHYAKRLVMIDHELGIRTITWRASSRWGATLGNGRPVNGRGEAFTPPDPIASSRWSARSTSSSSA